MAIAWVERLFGRQKTTKDVAKERLRLVLMQDRATLPGPMMEELRRELMTVLSRYVEIDDDEMDVTIERDDQSGGSGSVALVANIPIRRVRTDRAAPPVAAKPPPSAKRR